MKQQKNQSKSDLVVPNHIAFIMDGNGRWAKKRGLPRKMGHVEGVEALRRVLSECKNIGVKVVSVFAFSTENWQRPKEEVDGIMKLIKKLVNKKELKTFLKEDVKVHISGTLDEKVPKDVKEAIEKAIETTKDCKKMVFNICFNYGGRAEIVGAVNKILQSKMKKVDEATFAKYLDTACIPDPDIIVRTSGEQRVSNFMMWQMAYSEFIFVKDKHWPDFGAEDVHKIVEEYNKRERRFGAIKE